MMETIKACPFCCGDKSIKLVDGGGKYWVECDYCGARGLVADRRVWIADDQDTPAKVYAIARWNEVSDAVMEAGK